MGRIIGGLGKVAAVVFLLLPFVSSGIDLTFHVNPGKENCFYEEGKIGQTMHVDYSVIATTQGDHDINFKLVDPHERTLLAEFRKIESTHEVKIKSDGVYKVCFDNTFSHFSQKTVAFGVEIESDSPDFWSQIADADLQPEETYEVAINDIEIAIANVRRFLTEIEDIQGVFRHLESRDRSIVESNFERINTWSMIYISCLFVIMLIQVVWVKSFFDDKYNVKKIVNSKFRRY